MTPCRLGRAVINWTSLVFGRKRIAFRWRATTRRRIRPFRRRRRRYRIPVGRRATTRRWIRPFRRRRIVAAGCPGFPIDVWFWTGRHRNRAGVRRDVRRLVRNRRWFREGVARRLPAHLCASLGIFPAGVTEIAVSIRLGGSLSCVQILGGVVCAHCGSDAGGGSSGYRNNFCTGPRCRIQISLNHIANGFSEPGYPELFQPCIMFFSHSLALKGAGAAA
jgi:hypothetical protein